MRTIRLFTFLIVILSTGGCAHKFDHHKEGYALPGTRTVVNEIYIDRTGKPAVRHKTVVLRNGQRLLFAGPDEFTIEFKKGSFFVDSDDNQRNTYRSRSGVASLEVSNKKTARLKSGTEFKYSVFVNGIELDPLARWIKDD